MQVARARGLARSPLLRLIPRGVGGYRGMGQDETIDPVTGEITYVPSQPSILQDLGQNITDLGLPSLQPTGPAPVSTSTPSSSGFNLSNLFNSITNAAVAGQKIYLSSQQPSLVPGTQAIYNPATGQYYNPTTGQVVNAPGAPGTSSTLFPAGLSTSSLGPILLFGGLGIGALFLLSAIGKH